MCKWSETPAHGFYVEIHVSTYAAGGQLTPTPEDIPEPSHSRVFREKFHSVYVVKGVWSLLTDLFLNRRKLDRHRQAFLFNLVSHKLLVSYSKCSKNGQDYNIILTRVLSGDMKCLNVIKKNQNKYGNEKYNNQQENKMKIKLHIALIM